jgi:hypothetical protein
MCILEKSAIESTPQIHQPQTVIRLEQSIVTLGLDADFDRLGNISFEGAWNCGSFPFSFCRGTRYVEAEGHSLLCQALRQCHPRVKHGKLSGNSLAKLNGGPFKESDKYHDTTSYVAFPVWATILPVLGRRTFA